MTQHLQACHCCGQIQQVGQREEGLEYCCTLCHSRLAAEKQVHWSNDPAFAFAAASLILYLPAILLPILRIDQFGMHHTSSLLGGTLELIHRGNWIVGIVVLLFSIILPLVKMLGILELLCLQWSSKHYRAWVYRFVEIAGRWGMLDVLLLALMVMLVKLDNLVEFQLGPAVFVFIGCVSCNMLASLFFNPHRIWSTAQQI